MSKQITFDSLTLACVVDGLQSLCDGRIQHIAQPGEHDIVLTVYKSGQGEVRWLINCSSQWARTHLITRKLQNPPQPPNFCMMLRKHLEGGRLVSVAQRRFDRILDITVRGHEGAAYLLTVEMMGRHSNIILVSQDRQILHAAKLISSKVSRVREVLPGRDYTPPPARQSPDPRAVTEQEFLKWLKTDAPDDFAEWLRTSFEGISGLLAREMSKRWHDLRNSDDSFDLATAWAAFNSVFETAREGDWQPVTLHDETGAVLGAYPLPLQSYPSSQQESCADIHPALENHFADVIPRAAAEQQRRSLMGILRRMLDMRSQALQQVQQGVQERGKAEQYRRWGELLLAHLHYVHKGQEKAELLDYYAEPPTTVAIPLDSTLTPQQNAERYFQRARHVEGNAARLQTLQEQLAEQKADLEAMLAKVEQATDLTHIEALQAQAANRGWLQSQAGQSLQDTGPKTSKGPSQTKPNFDGKRIRELTSPDGWQVLIGENAEANDYLVQRVAQSNDWWLHVRAGTGSHVVIRTQNTPLRVPPSTLHFAAQLAALNSRARHSSLVAVDYTLRKYVRRPRGGAPGFVTYTHEKTLDVTPAESTR